MGTITLRFGMISVMFRTVGEDGDGEAQLALYVDCGGKCGLSAARPVESGHVFMDPYNR